jgi:hypothetical protein
MDAVTPRVIGVSLDKGTPVLTLAANASHYICTLYLAKHFFAPMHLVEKGLEEP